MSELNVTFLTSTEQVEGQFDYAVPLLEPVITQAAHGEFTVEDLRRLNLDGRAITAIIRKGVEPVMAMVFEFVHYPQQLAVNIMALGGVELDGVVHEFWETFRAWCKEAGATNIEAACSPAMARMLSRYEFKTTYQLVRAAL